MSPRTKTSDHLVSVTASKVLVRCSRRSSTVPRLDEILRAALFGRSRDLAGTGPSVVMTPAEATQSRRFIDEQEHRIGETK